MYNISLDNLDCSYLSELLHHTMSSNNAKIRLIHTTDTEKRMLNMDNQICKDIISKLPEEYQTVKDAPMS